MRPILGLGCGLMSVFMLGSAAAQVSYYAVSLENHDKSFEGYARLEWSDANNARGQLCLKESVDAVQDLLQIPVAATKPQEDVLQLDIQQLDVPNTPGLVFSEQPLMYRGKVKTQVLNNTVVTTVWKYKADVELPVVKSMSFIEVPAQLIQGLQFRISDDDYSYIRYSRNKSCRERYGKLVCERGVRYQLRNYDGLSKEAVLALERKNPPYFGDGGYTRGRVLAIVSRDRLDELRAFLHKEGGGGVIEEWNAPWTWRSTPFGFGSRSLRRSGACEPIMQVSISVSPFLEFYYVRKLQTSGVVLTAYVEELGAGAGFSRFSGKNKQLAELFETNHIKLEEKDRQIWAMLHDQVRTFVDTRRSDFKEHGTVARLLSGSDQVLAYRVEIVGPAFAECSRNRWEKIVLQIVLQAVFEDKLVWLFQIQEGFFAPGSMDRRPDDSRINENRIPDGRLQQLQDLIGGFLVGRGFFGDDQIVPASTEDVRCKL